MESLWIALPMVGCAAMMVLMMRMMGGGRDRSSDAPPAEDTSSKRAELEDEAARLRARLGEQHPDVS